MVMLPTGTVTYVMTDIVGSSPLWERNAEAMNTAVRDHEQIARVCAANNNGHLIKERGEGDSLFLVFDSAHNAVQMALDFQRALSVAEWPEGMPISVRCAIHTGASMVRDNDYYGPPVNRCARLRSVAGPGQIVISNATVHLLGDRLPEGSALKDLGLHRLRDLLRPERLYELTHPELKSSGETILTLNKVQHNLPIQLTSFVGREEDVRRVAGLVRMTRLVTLTGSGGCGKTRLALQVASESCDEFPDGVWFVDLTQVAPGENCDAAVARALGIHAPAQGSSRQQLVESLSFREALLILDNCEHVVDTAAELVTDLLAAGESLKILATSRELLRVPGELRWRVPPLSLPAADASLEATAACDSVKLFVERASYVSDFKLTEKNAAAVGELCRLLDGIPLALEMAASNASLLTPAQMVGRFAHQLQRLRNEDRKAPARHQTLWATLDWSYGMLDEKSKLLLQRCSVFNGSWTLESAEGVCADESLPVEDIAECLRSLLDRSLIFVEESGAEETRYRMLQTVKEYATNTIELIDALKDRHAFYFAAFMRPLAVASRFDEIEQEVDNVLPALDWLAITSPATAIQAMLEARYYWIIQGHYMHGIAMLDRLEQLIECQLDLATALNLRGIFQLRLNRYEDADRNMTAAYNIWAADGNEARMAAALNNRGMVAFGRLDYETSSELFERALQLYGDEPPDMVAHVRMNLGRCLIELERFEEGINLSERAIVYLEENGFVGRAATAGVNIAMAHVLQGDTDAAALRLNWCFARWCSDYDIADIPSGLAILCHVCRKRGLVDTACKVAVQCKQLIQSHGLRVTARELDFLKESLESTIAPNTAVNPKLTIDESLKLTEQLALSFQ